MSKSIGKIALPAAIVLVGINLRPTMAAIGPMLDAIQQSTGLSDTGASLLTTLPVLLMGFCILGTARLKNVFGERLGIATGITLILLACLGRWIWVSAASMLITAIMSGVGIAMAQALMPSVIRHRYGHHSPTMMGIYSTAIMGGAMVSSAASPWIAHGLGWPAALGIWMFPALAGLQAWWSATSQSDVLPTSLVLCPVYRKHRSWLLVAFFGLGTGAYTLVLAWLAPFYMALGWSAEAAGGLLGILTLAQVIAAIAVSAFISHLPDRRPVLLASIVALLTSMLCLCLAPNLFAWPAVFLAGLGLGALFPLSLIVAMDHGKSPAEAGAIAGFVQGGGYVLAALFPLVAGLSREYLSSLTPAWWFMATLCFVMASIAITLSPGDRVFFQC